MPKVYYDNQEMSMSEMNRQVRERADRIREVSRQEASAGITTTDENDINFFKEG